VGDMVSIQLFKEDSTAFFDIYRSNPEIIKIVNLSFKNGFVIDHDSRNELVKKKNTRNRNYMSGAFLALVILQFFLTVAKKNLGLFQEKNKTE
jgi:hypothetical protein